jgi:hypothetical protein
MRTSSVVVFLMQALLGSAAAFSAIPHNPYFFWGGRMESTELITLKVPRSETENLFLQRVVQAAIQAYRNDQHGGDKIPTVDGRQSSTHHNEMSHRSIS